MDFFPFLGKPRLALFSRSRPAFTSPTNTYIPLYTSFPCWFCSRVLARSMGNTQVTPTRPAIPPLMSFAEMLGHGEEKKRTYEKRFSASASLGRGHERRARQVLSLQPSRVSPPQHPPWAAARSWPLLPHKLGTSLQEALLNLPDQLTLTHSEGFTKLKYCRPAGKGAHQGVGSLANLAWPSKMPSRTAIKADSPASCLEASEEVFKQVPTLFSIEM